MKKSRYISRFIYALLLSVALLETGAQVAAISDHKRAPSFQLDPILGWIKIKRSAQGSVNAENSAPKTLILGDSFVFGEGVGLQERFDQQMIKNGYTHRIINRGVSGYSTDQELISATQDLERLKAGDAVVLVTFGDDLRGLISSFFAGRPKPRYHLEGGVLRLTPPSISWIDRLRERSYLFRAFKKMIRPRSAATLILGEAKLNEAQQIYRELVLKHLAPVAERGVKVVIVFHGQNIVDSDFGPGLGQQVAYEIKQMADRYGFTFLGLSDEFQSELYRQPNNVHWNAEGHQRFAQWLLPACDKSNNQLHLSQKEIS